MRKAMIVTASALATNAIATRQYAGLRAISFLDIALSQLVYISAASSTGLSAIGSLFDS
jgi:hypothetical protein